MSGTNGNVTANVTTGKPKIGGAVFIAPYGTTAPTAADAEMDSAFVCLGYCSDDGLSNDNTPSTDTVKAWGGDVVLVTESEKTDEFTFTLLEALSADVLKAVYGDSNVSGTDLATGLTVRANSNPATAHAWVFDVKMNGGNLKRIVVPNAIITELDTIEYKDGDPVGYGITLTAMPDSTIEYDTHREYLKTATATTSEASEG